MFQEAPSMAPPRVPEERMTGLPVLRPRLIPETTASGFCLQRWERAMLTQSVGVPSSA